MSEQTMFLIAIVFCLVLGLSLLLLIGFPLLRQANKAYENIMTRCDFSEQTRRLYEYSQVLHNIRAQPECAAKFSVEECTGYEEASPYTSFLKSMEADLHC